MSFLRLPGRGLRDRLVQRYIERPLLLWGRRKFDLRVWVLVRSFSPLQVYLYSEVYIRLCAEPYDPKDLTNKFRHISNWSLNRLKAGGGMVPETTTGSLRQSGTQAEALQQVASQEGTESCAATTAAMKRTAADIEETLLAAETTLPLQCLRVALAAKTGREDYWEAALLPRLRYLVVQTMRGGRHFVVQRNSCFELYGLDVLIDEQLRPWLLEVNLSPACSSRQPWLRCILKRMTEQLLEIVLENPRHHFTAAKGDDHRSSTPGGDTGTGREGSSVATPHVRLEGVGDKKLEQGGHWELLFDETLPLEKAIAILPPMANPTNGFEKVNPVQRQGDDQPSRELIEDLYAGGSPGAAAVAISSARRCKPRLQGLSVHGQRITHSLHRFAAAAAQQ